MARDGTALAFLLRLGLCREWGGVRVASDIRRPFPPRPPALAIGPTADRPFDVAAYAATFSGRGRRETLQCAAEAGLPRRLVRALPVYCPCGTRDVAASRRRLSVAALDLRRAPVGPHDPLRLRVLAPRVRGGSSADGSGLGRLEQHPLDDHRLV